MITLEHKLPETLKNSIDQNVQNGILASNSRTAWPTKIVTLFLSFSDSLLQYVYNYFSK